MTGFFRRRNAAVLTGVAYCDGGDHPSTAASRSATRVDRTRTRALSHLSGLR